MIGLKTAVLTGGFVSIIDQKYNCDYANTYTYFGKIEFLQLAIIKLLLKLF